MSSQDETRVIKAFSKKEKDAFLPGENYLLAIGIDKYENHQDLYNAVSDSEAIARLLQERYSFHHVTKLLDKDASRKQIRRAFEDLGRKLTPQDNLLIFYAGHGYHRKKGNLGYLIPQDAEADTSSDFIENTTLLNDLRQIEARHILAVLDCCFSSSLLTSRDAGIRAVAEAVEIIPSRYALAASNIELAADGVAGANSPFTKVLLEVLEQNAEEKLPVSHLFQEARKRLKERKVKQTPIGGSISGVLDFGQEGGEFVFYLRQAKAAAFETEKGSKQQKAEVIDVEVMRHQIRLEILEEERQKRATEEAIHIRDEREIEEKEEKKRRINKIEKGLTGFQNFFEKKLESSLDIELIDADFIKISGGSFNMGCKMYKEEMPVHAVIVHDFHLCKYPVTQEQWNLIMKSNLSQFQGNEKLPVENVSWDGAKAFIKDLNEITGKNYRLPTEAEWEFAARGGIFSRGYEFSGSNDIIEVGWHMRTSPWNTQVVGQKRANELGLFDMSGNVWEWCQDDWHENYMSAPNDGSAWITNGFEKVCRGGAYSSGKLDCRVSKRVFLRPSTKNGSLGFRLAHD